MMNLFKEDSRITKVFGPPGTGKTTWILNKVEELLGQGIKPDKIALVSFTNKAVDEFIDRALLKFCKYSKEDFPWFRTIHSLCNRCGDGRKILSQIDLYKFAKSLGLDVSTYTSIEDNIGSKSGDKLIQIENLARLKMQSLEKTFNEYDTDFSYEALAFWQIQYNKFKKDRSVVDFTDLLQNFDYSLNVDYFFIDEAQDLSTLQWKVMEKASKLAKEIYIAGDDDQSIYKFAGSDTNYFLNIYNQKDIVLSKSYRLPIKIYEKSKEILKDISVRKEKEYKPAPENGQGEIEYVNSLNDIKFDNQQNYLILFRNRWLAKSVSEDLKGLNLPFLIFGKNSLGDDLIKAIICWNEWQKEKQASKAVINLLSKFCSLIRGEIPLDLINLKWFEAFDLLDSFEKEYVKECFKNGYHLLETPKIIISTIHQAKGGEADNVILFTDVSNTVYDNIESEDEKKVWYVAITRARKKLFIVNPESLRYYNL